MLVTRPGDSQIAYTEKVQVVMDQCLDRTLIFLAPTLGLIPLLLLGAATTTMEIGSITKALTGLVIADSVNRRELDLDFPISTYLPQLVGFPAAKLRCANWSPTAPATSRSGPPPLAGPMVRTGWQELGDRQHGPGHKAGRSRNLGHPRVLCVFNPRDRRLPVRPQRPPPV